MQLLSVCSKIPALRKLPVEVQKKVMIQKRRAFRWHRSGKEFAGKEFVNDFCFCLFFRKYLQPCAHMFHHDLIRESKFLTTERWEKFASFFEEGGMEVYAKHVRMRVPDSTIRSEETVKEKQHHDYHEAAEILNNSFWRLQSLPAEQSAEKTAELVQRLRDVSKAMSLDTLLN